MTREGLGLVFLKNDPHPQKGPFFKTPLNTRQQVQFSFFIVNSNKDKCKQKGRWVAFCAHLDQQRDQQKV